MERLVTSEARLAILGGGQLGKMLLLAGGNWHVLGHVLDPDPECPCSSISEALVVGDFRDRAQVVEFGADHDLITIEIEQVDVAGLDELARRGVIVRPQPDVVATIQDKGTQKSFYEVHGIPTAPFELFDGAEAVREAVASGERSLPFVQKLRRLGYDGRGVVVVRTPDDLDESLLDAPSVVESLVPIDKELSVLVARNPQGQLAVYPVVEMAFDPNANLVDWLICPARIDDGVADRARKLACRVAEELSIEGLLAVEMFLDRDGELLVNESAPRPHNSGHHTIESVITSQYEQHLRAIFGLPLGSTRLKTPAVMVNLLGEPGHVGPVRYQGLADCLAREGVKVHIYGKRTTRPYRKMGHATVLDPELDAALETARFVRNTLKVTT